jgi:hypothetical protein
MRISLVRPPIGYSSARMKAPQDYTWELREADKTSEIAIAIYAVKVKAFIVFTAADDKRATAQSNQDASDL